MSGFMKFENPGLRIAIKSLSGIVDKTPKFLEHSTTR